MESVSREHSCQAWLSPARLAVEMGDVEAPNLRTVEAKRKAKWRPRGQATEQKHGPDWLPREVPYLRDPNNLKSTGTCKPEGELAILKSGRGMTWRQLKAGEDS
jgi:hypothetical protein